MQVGSLGLEDPLAEGMTTHSSILAWKIAWTKGPGGPKSMGCKEPDRTNELACSMQEDGGVVYGHGP